jgi:hypothetical protein
MVFFKEQIFPVLLIAGIKRPAVSGKPCLKKLQVLFSHCLIPSGKKIVHPRWSGKPLFLL